MSDDVSELQAGGCPYCGHEDAEIREDGLQPLRPCYHVVCGICGARGSGMPTQRQAVEVWNRPAPLVWSSERPKVAGDYKFRYALARGNHWVRHVTRHDIAATDGWLDNLDFGPLECAGPIPEPMEPPK